MSNVVWWYACACVVIVLFLIIKNAKKSEKRLIVKAPKTYLKYPVDMFGLKWKDGYGPGHPTWRRHFGDYGYRNKRRDVTNDGVCRDSCGCAYTAKEMQNPHLRDMIKRGEKIMYRCISVK